MTPAQERALLEEHLAHAKRMRDLAERKAESELAKARAEQRTAELVESVVRQQAAKNDLTKLPRLS